MSPRGTTTECSNTKPTNRLYSRKKVSNLFKHVSFSKGLPVDKDRARLLEQTELEWAMQQKQKEVIMKYRNMSESEAERYLDAKKNGEYEKSTIGKLFLADAWGTWS